MKALIILSTFGAHACAGAEEYISTNEHEPFLCKIQAEPVTIIWVCLSTQNQGSGHVTSHIYSEPVAEELLLVRVIPVLT